MGLLDSPWTWALGLGLLAAGSSSSAKGSGGDVPPSPDPEPDPMPKPDPPPPPVPQPPPGSQVLFPLPGSKEKVRASSFGSGRPWGSAHPTTRHPGIDINANYLDPVIAPEDGVVAKIQGWDGKGTRGVLLQLLNGPVLVFGAVHPDHLPEKGAVIRRGELVGRIGRYPKGDTMLHFEMWKVGELARPDWLPGTDPPAGLLDPFLYLSNAKRT